ncbi:MAG: polyphenol oxidase family protein, partial [Candidatus Hydrothermia bacterium]
MEWINEKGYYELVGIERFRAYFSTRIGFPPVGNFISLNQLHTGIVQVAPIEPDTTGDAIITNREGIFIAIRTADCGSVFLFDEENHALGLAHAGWRGALTGVHLNAIEAMGRFYGTRPSDLMVAMGPMICGRCYRVGDDVARLFPGFTTARRGSWFLDLPRYLVQSLIEAGIKQDNMILPPACTAEDHWLWSARRDGSVGRNWALACIGLY